MSDFNVSTSIVPEMTVSQISKAIQNVVQSNFSCVRLKGEISGFKRHTSGHLYMALKDDSAVIDAVCWRGTASHLKHQPEEGLEVICQGRITTYPARSKYQFVIETLEPAGVGALLKVLQERKERLHKEGLFAPERKVAIPYIPKTIGVITSETGAVIKDILHRLADRFPVNVLLWPVHVQGDTAAKEIIAALKGFQALKELMRPDVVIVARGGGSVEDLWAFNDEGLARAVSDFSIPLISAVGHETDTTLIDYVADRRAPTPTAAAEMAVPVRRELLEHVHAFHQRLMHTINRLVQDKQRLLEMQARTIINPMRFLEERLQRLDDLDARLVRGFKSFVHDKTLGAHMLMRRLMGTDIARNVTQYQSIMMQLEKRLAVCVRHLIATHQERLAAKSALLAHISHHAILKKGYTMMCGADGSVITSVTQLQVDMEVSVILKDGDKKAKIL